MPEIEYAFLADAADVEPGQKFHVLGGGVSRLAGPAFPIQHPHLALVVGLRMSQPERNREHELGFILLTPSGEQVAQAGGRIVTHGTPDTSEVILTLSIDLWNIVLPVAGEYSLRITINGNERKRLPLYVSQGPQPVAEQPRYVQ